MHPATNQNNTQTLKTEDVPQASDSTQSVTLQETSNIQNNIDESPDNLQNLLENLLKDEKGN